MSEQKKAPAKTSQPGTFQKILNWFKRLPGRIAKPFKNMWYELKKVSWPTKERLVSYSFADLRHRLHLCRDHDRRRAR